MIDLPRAGKSPAGSGSGSRVGPSCPARESGEDSSSRRWGWFPPLPVKRPGDDRREIPGIARGGSRSAYGAGIPANLVGEA